MRPANTSRRDPAAFFSPPLSKTSDIPRFLADLQDKFSAPAEEAEPEPTQPRRWFHVSDSTVTEVSEEKVLKAQAYLLFYERFL